MFCDALRIAELGQVWENSNVGEKYSFEWEQVSPPSTIHVLQSQPLTFRGSGGSWEDPCLPQEADFHISAMPISLQAHR